MKISKDKQYETATGLPVKIYEVYEDEFHGAIEINLYGEKSWMVQAWGKDGDPLGISDIPGINARGDLRLVEIQEKKEPEIGSLCYFQNKFIYDSECFNHEPILRPAFGYGRLVSVEDSHRRPYKDNLGRIWTDCKECEEEFTNYQLRR